MKFDAVRFCKDYNIPFVTKGKNVSSGWVGINCPRCADTGFHGGINIANGYYYCWKCGHDFIENIIHTLTGITLFEIKKLLQSYSNVSGLKEKKEKPINQSLSLPTGTGPLEMNHMNYLFKRKFDADKLVTYFKIKGTGPIGNYKFRIIAPIYYQGNLVSFQGRDITGKSELRYKACPKDKEVIHHKNILYAGDMATKDKVVVVEGITDVWRLGPGAVATFGTSFTTNQMNLLSKYKDIFIMYDDEETAQGIAEKLGYALSSLSGTAVHIIHGFNSDPGDLDDRAAKQIMHEIFGKRNDFF